MRAIATALRDPGAVLDLPAATPEDAKVEILSQDTPRQLVGQPASPGLASGRVCRITAGEDIGRFRAGNVLVCDAIQPMMTHLVPLAAAVVERRGGMLIHGAIIAREMGIPCVNGVARAVEQLRDGDVVTVDGHLGIVTVGPPEFDLELACVPARRSPNRPAGAAAGLSGAPVCTGDRVTDEPGSGTTEGQVAVDLWAASLDPASALASRLAWCLAPDEEARARRFVASRDRDRFTAGRAFLRLLLAKYLGVAAREVDVRADPHGKPFLCQPRCGLPFNLAHSGTLAVCAVTHGSRDVGVDVEHVKPLENAESLARVVLSPPRTGAPGCAAGASPTPIVLRSLDAQGGFSQGARCGLSRPLHSLEVSFGPGEPPRLLQSLAGTRPSPNGFASSTRRLKPEPAVSVRWRWRVVRFRAALDLAVEVSPPPP